VAARRRELIGGPEACQITICRLLLATNTTALASSHRAPDADGTKTGAEAGTGTVPLALL
jgi:hypothetical protein